MAEASRKTLDKTLSKGFDENRRQKVLIENVKDIVVAHGLNEADALVAVSWCNLKNNEYRNFIQNPVYQLWKSYMKARQYIYFVGLLQSRNVAYKSMLIFDKNREYSFLQIWANIFSRVDQKLLSHSPETLTDKLSSNIQLLTCFSSGFCLSLLQNVWLLNNYFFIHPILFL